MEPQYLIRSVREDDLEDLYRLSKLVYFLNLPSDRGILQEKIRRSVDSFVGEIEDRWERQYILVLEDLEDNSVVGTSSLIARHGSPRSPHVYFELAEIQKYSESIHFGIIHRVLRLKFDDDGPTEIGGLVIHPSYRGTPERLGKQLSYARFMLVQMRREWFKNEILSELMPPLKEDGTSILWEALGRKFTNLSYQEADLLSRKNKEFVESLFPEEDIYTCLLPGDVRDVIGKVGEETEPVKHMLESIGFRWREHIDPFDGGPHYLAKTDEITVIQQTRKVSPSPRRLAAGEAKGKHRALISTWVDGEFYCQMAPYRLEGSELLVPETTAANLHFDEAEETAILPLPERSR